MDAQENPYQSPQTIDVALPLQRGQWPHTYVSAHTRAVWVLWLFSATIAVLLLLFIGVSVSITLAHEAGYSQPHELNPAIQSMRVVALCSMGLLVLLAAISLATGVAFLMWLHRVHRNLPALQARRIEFSSGWAVGYFFIPVLNLFRPWQVMHEVWRESDPARLVTAGKPFVAGRSSSAAIVNWWWSSFLLLHFVNQAARPFIDKSTPEARLAALWIGFSIFALAIAAAALAIVMVYRVDANQSRRYNAILEHPPASLTFPLE